MVRHIPRRAGGAPEKSTGGRMRHRPRCHRVPASPRNRTTARSILPRSSSFNLPVRWPILLRRTVVILSTMRYDGAVSPFRGSGAIGTRSSGAPAPSLVKGHTVTESVVANSSFRRTTAGRGCEPRFDIAAQALRDFFDTQATLIFRFLCFRKNVVFPPFIQHLIAQMRKPKHTYFPVYLIAYVQLAHREPRLVSAAYYRAFDSR